MMRRHNSSALPLPVAASAPRSRSRDWATIRTLLPYLWEYRVRVTLAVACLIAAKLANVGVPLVLKQIVDALGATQQALVLPVALLAAYGALRLSTTLFTELRELLFSRVTQRAVRKIALQVFRHLHALSLRFHLARQTGGLTRDIERGTRGITSLISFTLFSILPTLIEIALVTGVLLAKYEVTFVLITFGTLIVYIGYTIGITEWRTNFRRTMNELDSKANTRAVDSLLNYETVKYFGNEGWEATRYDESMQRFEAAAIKSQSSLSLLNIGQSTIIAIGVTLIMWQATQGVVTFVEGDVIITPKADNHKRKLVSNTIVYPGDMVQTMKNGRVEIIINRESVVRMRENTRLTIENFRDNQNNTGKSRVGFSLGTVWTKMKKFKDKISRFDLELPTAIAGVHGTVYEASVAKDTSAEVKVFDGEVAVSGASKAGTDAAAAGSAQEVSGPDEVAGPDEVSLEQWVQIVREMQKIRIDKKGKPQALESFKKDRRPS